MMKRLGNNREGLRTKKAVLILLIVLVVATIPADNASAVELAVSEYTDKSITLNWTRYAGDDFRRYEIQWDKGHGWWILDIILDQNTTEYEIENLVVGQTYDYQVWVLYFDDLRMELKYEKSNVVTAGPVPYIDGPVVDTYTFGRPLPEYVLFLILILLISIALNVVLGLRLWRVKRKSK